MSPNEDGEREQSKAHTFCDLAKSRTSSNAANESLPLTGSFSQYPRWESVAMRTRSVSSSGLSNPAIPLGQIGLGRGRGGEGLEKLRSAREGKNGGWKVVRLPSLQTRKRNSNHAALLPVCVRSRKAWRRTCLLRDLLGYGRRSCWYGRRRAAAAADAVADQTCCQGLPFSSLPDCLLTVHKRVASLTGVP